MNFLKQLHKIGPQERAHIGIWINWNWWSRGGIVEWNWRDLPTPTQEQVAFFDYYEVRDVARRYQAKWNKLCEGPPPTQPTWEKLFGDRY